MIVPPPALDLDDNADAPLTRDSARLGHEQPDDQRGEQRRRKPERVLGYRSRS
jgi:hypothetical protein